MKLAMKIAATLVINLWAWYFAYCVFVWLYKFLVT
jgi:hypothetical protein